MVAYEQLNEAHKNGVGRDEPTLTTRQLSEMDSKNHPC